MPTLELAFDNARAVSEALSFPLMLRFETATIIGVGGEHAPHLQILVALEQTRRTAEREYFPIAMSAELHLGALSVGPPPTATLLSTAPIPLQLNISPMPLLLPLTTRAIERVERARKRGDVELSLYVRATVAQHTTNNGGLVQNLYQTQGLATLRIARSQWVDTILTGMGVARSYFVEIQIPTQPQIAKTFQKALKELEGAAEAFRQDAYDDTGVKCRKTIDVIASAFKLELKGDPPTYTNRIEAFRRDKLVPHIGETRAKLVAAELLALWPVLSGPAHPGSTTLDRPFAKHLLIATTNLVSYLGTVFHEQ